MSRLGIRPGLGALDAPATADPPAASGSSSTKITGAQAAGMGAFVFGLGAAKLGSVAVGAGALVWVGASVMGREKVAKTGGKVALVGGGDDVLGFLVAIGGMAAAGGP